MSDGECKVIQLWARINPERAKATSGGRWCLTGADPNTYITARTDKPRRFLSQGVAVLWLLRQMGAYNKANPEASIGYNVHMASGETHELRPGKRVVIVPAEGGAGAEKVAAYELGTRLHAGNKIANTGDVVTGTHPALKRFGPHEWIQRDTPAYVREGFANYECSLCGLRVRTPLNEKPGVPGTCPRNPVEHHRE